jgi:hypothetical protein
MGFFFGSVLEYILKAIGCSIKTIMNSVHSFGSGEWPRVEAIVTADPERFERISSTTVEVVYSYRFEGELYTGFHEEPCFLSKSENMERFSKGRHFIVRVKPSEPEVSIVRETDQASGIQKRLEEIDEFYKRDRARN